MAASDESQFYEMQDLVQMDFTDFLKNAYQLKMSNLLYRDIRNFMIHYVLVVILELQGNFEKFE